MHPDHPAAECRAQNSSHQDSDTHASPTAPSRTSAQCAPKRQSVVARRDPHSATHISLRRLARNAPFITALPCGERWKFPICWRSGDKHKAAERRLER